MSVASRAFADARDVTLDIPLGATELVVAGFDTLVKAGYQPEVAYYEVMHELKLIVDLLHEGGIAKMHNFISETVDSPTPFPPMKKP